MRDLMDDGENRAVRTFLQLIYGGVTGSITTKRMQEHLEESGWEDHTPAWAKENHTLTKEGVQMWLRFLFNLEKTVPDQWEVKPVMFVQHQTLTHVKTQCVYHIVLTPDNCRIEKTGEPAYAYRAYIKNTAGEISEGKEIWVRGQKEMEDGRFVLSDQSGRSRDVDPIGSRTQRAIHELGIKFYPPFIRPEDSKMKWEMPVELPPTLVIHDGGFNGQTVTNAERERLEHDSNNGVVGFLTQPNEIPLPEVAILFPTPECISALAKSVSVEDPENALFFAHPRSSPDIMATYIEISPEQAEIKKHD
jgi:hypothetical protein